MVYLSVVVALVAVLTVFNLLLCFAVIRRLRAQSEELARLTGGVPDEDPTVPVGSVVAGLPGTGTRLYGFFQPGCAPCEKAIPQFRAYAADHGLAAVAVVVGEPAEAAPYVARLGGDAVVEPSGGPVSGAFAVTSFPAVCLVDRAGVVLASGNAIADLPDLVPA